MNTDPERTTKVIELLLEWYKASGTGPKELKDMDVDELAKFTKFTEEQLQHLPKNGSSYKKTVILHKHLDKMLNEKIDASMATRPSKSGHNPHKFNRLGAKQRVELLKSIGIKNPKAHLNKSYNDFSEEYKNRIDKELGGKIQRSTA